MRMHWFMKQKIIFFPLDTNVNYSKNNPNVWKLLKYVTGNGRRATGDKHQKQENKTGNKTLINPLPYQ